MPAIKTPSSSLPASPRIGYKPLDIEKIFNNLPNGNCHCLTNGYGGKSSNHSNNSNKNDSSISPVSRELSSELAQLHSLGAELRAGLLKAVEALRLVQNNDETMRNNIESANVQTQRGITELTKVISAVQDDSNQLRAKFDTLDSSNKEMRQKISELEKILLASNSTTSAPKVEISSVPTYSSPVIAQQPPGPQQEQQLSQNCVEATNNTMISSTTKPQQPLYHMAAIKFRQSFLNFLTAEVHFCRSIAKMCQQQQQAVAILSARRNLTIGSGPNSSLSPTQAAETLASVLPTSLWQVYRVHAEFLAQLEGRMSKWGHWSCIGDVFLRLLDNKTSHFGDIYKLYANELLSIFGAGGSPVCAPLLLPFRRLADYVAFLEATRQGLDPDHPDLYNIAKSSEKLRTQITRLNEQQLRYLLVADNVAPIGSGTAMDQIMTSSCMPKMMTLNSKNPSKDKLVINNGCATIARTRYTQNSKNNGQTNGKINCDLKKAKSANNVTLSHKSRSHGDLYVAAHHESADSYYNYQDNNQQIPNVPFSILPNSTNSTSNATSGLLSNVNNNCSTGSDDEDEEGDEADLISPVNYADLFNGDIQLTTRSLPRSRFRHQQPQNGTIQPGKPQHQRNLSDDSQVVLDCWTSKAANTLTTFATTTTTASRPCSATTSSGTTPIADNMMADLQAIPPMPHRSCETSNPASRFHHYHRENGGGNNREKVAIFVSASSSANNNGNGTISSGSSGSGGSTSGKSTYQPLESMKQSLLNLFNGYKKRKRGTLRGNGLISPVGNGINTPQIRIISPPSTLLDKNQLPYSVLANSNFHVDIRNENGHRAYNSTSNSCINGVIIGPACVQQQQFHGGSSNNASSTDSSNIPSPPSSPATAVLTVPSVSPPRKSPILNGAA